MYESNNSPCQNNGNCVIIKYADDTLIIGPLCKSDDHTENFYTSAIGRFNLWCKVNFLDLNVKETKEDN